MPVRAAKYFDPPFFGNLTNSSIFIEVQTHPNLRELFCLSVLNLPPWRIFSDFTLKWNCWRNTNICEDSTSSSIDCAGLGISNQGFTGFYWTISMLCPLFGRAENTQLGVLPNIFPAFLIGLPGDLGDSMVFLGQCETQLCNCSTWGTQRFAVILSAPFSPLLLQELGQYLSVIAHPDARWASLGFKVWWEIHHPQAGVKGRLQHLSVQLLHTALCWRSVLKLLICSSCSSVWFHSRSEIPVWSPQGSLSSLARDLKQQEFGLPSFSKAETYANPYLSAALCLIHLLILPPPFGWVFLFPSLYRNVNRCRHQLAMVICVLQAQRSFKKICDK